MIDPSLLDRVRRLDRQALGEIHDQFYPAVFRYVRFRIDDLQTAEDITSEVFIRFLQALRRTDHPIEDIRAWLMGTASNMVNDFYRSKYRQPVEDLAEREDLPEPQSIENISEHNERLDEVSRCLRRLTPEQQHVLALRFSQELSLAETAGMVGRSVNAVKVIQFRALAALRRLLGEDKQE